MDTNAIAFRPAEAARAVGLSRSSFYELLKAGELRAFKVGAATLISADELRRWVAQHEEQMAGIAR